MLRHVQRCSCLDPTRAALMAWDVSSTVIGIAVTDRTRAFVRPLTRTKLHGVDRRPLPPAVLMDKLDGLMREHGICGVVMGWPQELDGSAGRRCHAVLSTLRALHAAAPLRAPVLLWDERFTTVDARLEMAALGASARRVKREND
ncbi:Resolvase, holliday junction-type, YqgF-like protein, partial [Tribonema minus]